MLAEHSGSVTLGKYDTSDNYLPQAGFKREKYASDTEWFWIPQGTGAADLKKLMKPKKDAPIKAVVGFLKKQSGLDLDVDSVMGKFEEKMQENPPPTTTPPPQMDPMADMGGMGDMGGLGGMGDMGMGGMGGMGGEEL